MSLHTPEGQQALSAAMAEKDPASLGAATRLRTLFPSELAAEALAQTGLRRKARAKFGDRADELFFTSDALEQATRPAVAAWRARRLREQGVTRVVDLGCGIGADSMACLDEGIEVIAVEIDATTASHAAANLPGATVIVGDAVALAPELLAGAGPETCVFIDPARRTEYGRTWNVEVFTPPWDFVLDLLAGPHSCVVKMGPGVPKQILPDGLEVLWVADGHDVVEASIWRTPDARPGHGAVLLPDGIRIDRDDQPLPVGELGRFLVEPHGAAIRASAIAALVPDGRLLDAHIAYITCDHAVDGPWLTCFEVDEVLDFNPKLLKRWVRENSIGTLEIKKRGIDVDPAELRKKLQPKGNRSATLVLARTGDGTKALVVHRL